MNIPFIQLKFPNKEMEEYFKIIFFVLFHSLLLNESLKRICKFFLYCNKDWTPKKINEMIYIYIYIFFFPGIILEGNKIK